MFAVANVLWFHVLLNQKALVFISEKISTFYHHDCSTFHLQAVGSCLDPKNICLLCALFGVSL
jgi:hypothetical protein